MGMNCSVITAATIGMRNAWKFPDISAVFVMEQHSADRFAPLRWYKHRVNLKLFRDAARIVPWSNWVKQALMDDYDVDASRLEVIPPGVDLATWFPKPRALENKPTRVLFVGGDLYRKVGATLLQAFENFRATKLRVSPRRAS